MEKILELDINESRNIDNILRDKQDINIIDNLSTAFGNSIKKGVDKMNLSEDVSEKVKNGLKKVDLKGIGSSIIEVALRTGMKSLGMKSSTFTNLKSIVEAIKEGDLKKGLNSGVDIAINLLKIPSSTKNLLKDGKNIIVDNIFEDELKEVMEKQKNTISRINKKCIDMEKAFERSDDKNLDKISKSLKKDLDKVMPIEDVIKKGRGILNRYELYKNKGYEELTEDELELCNKLAV